MRTLDWCRRAPGDRGPAAAYDPVLDVTPAFDVTAAVTGRPVIRLDGGARK